MDPIASVASRKFRAGKAFELVVFDRLAPQEQVLLEGMRSDPHFYGVLRPLTGSGRTVKSVNKDIALLFLTLQSEGRLPSFALNGDEKVAAKGVWELVLDGILEIEEDGKFVSGPEALAVVGRNGRPPAAQGLLGGLSAQALRYGERLRFEDPRRLAVWLYQYGRQPVSPGWARRLPNSKSVLAFVGASDGSALSRDLAARWESAKEKDAGGWLAWRSRNGRNFRRAQVPHKLYVSPNIEAMPQAFAAIVGTLSTRAVHFKIGASAGGLTRPDKMVAYFDDKVTLLEAAADLQGKLAGIAPHGVPFTAEITTDGLLSWGMDPPVAEGIFPGQDRESWRQWVVNRLAVAMIAAQSDASSKCSVSEFALERLRCEGVDIEGWTPSASVWQTTS